MESVLRATSSASAHRPLSTTRSEPECDRNSQDRHLAGVSPRAGQRVRECPVVDQAIGRSARVLPATYRPELGVAPEKFGAKGDEWGSPESFRGPICCEHPSRSARGGASHIGPIINSRFPITIRHPVTSGENRHLRNGMLYC